MVYLLQCLKFKTDQAQDAKKMEKLNNIFFTLMARGPETDITEVTGKEQIAQPRKRGRGRKQYFSSHFIVGFLDLSQSPILLTFQVLTFF
ncbi:putative signal recognition particle, SRP9/SRP14 subunit, signal recognition particle SRP9 [Helianthus debilis subsp. tardiflorus]